ncbi:MAG: hypothetical protein ACU0DK_04320 [Pseudooceanicola sp.]
MVDRSEAGFRRIAAVLTLAGLLAAGGWASGFLSPMVAILLLFGTALGLAGVLRADPARAFTLLGATLTLGPLAGPFLLLLSLPAREAVETARDEDLADGASAAERIMAQIESGRRFRSRTGRPASLVCVFDGGDLGQQQTALKALARNYGPELRPALDRALASEIPAVRVQAAAVYAVLRDSYAARARDLIKGTAKLRPAEMTAELETLRKCGFVDPALLEDVTLPPSVFFPKEAGEAQHGRESGRAMPRRARVA